MKKIINLVLILGTIAMVQNLAAQERVSTKMAIQISSGNTHRARAREKIKAGDSLQIFVQVEKEGFMYLVHYDHKTATLLNPHQLKIKSGVMRVFPDEINYYQFDGELPIESVTILFSPTEVPEMKDLAKAGTISSANWAAIEAALVEKSKIELGEKGDVAWSIGGNVRSLGQKKKTVEMQTFSGNGLVVRRNEFEVEK